MSQDQKIDWFALALVAVLLLTYAIGFWLLFIMGLQNHPHMLPLTIRISLTSSLFFCVGVLLSMLTFEAQSVGYRRIRTASFALLGLGILFGFAFIAVYGKPLHNVCPS
jgi:hypothetical protein